jgi:lysozyme family protein
MHTLQKLNTVQDWSIPEVLFQLEKYNGFGYRTRHRSAVAIPLEPQHALQFREVYRGRKILIRMPFRTSVGRR